MKKPPLQFMIKNFYPLLIWSIAMFAIFEFGFMCRKEQTYSSSGDAKEEIESFAKIIAWGIVFWLVVAVVISFIQK